MHMGRENNVSCKQQGTELQVFPVKGIGFEWVSFVFVKY